MFLRSKTSWFVAGFALSMVLGGLVTEAFAFGKPGADTFRKEMQRTAKACHLSHPEWEQCLDASTHPRETAAYVGFLDDGTGRLTADLRARGGVKLVFAPSRYLDCEVSEELLRAHPDSVGLQILIADALKGVSQSEIVPSEIRIETVDPELLKQNMLKRVEMQGGALVLRAALGSCAALDTGDPAHIEQESSARSRFLGYELSRKLFRR